MGDIYGDLYSDSYTDVSSPPPSRTVEVPAEPRVVTV